MSASWVNARDSSTHAVFRELIELDEPLSLQYHYLELSSDLRDALSEWMRKEYPNKPSFAVVNYGEAFFSAGPTAIIPSFQHQFTANYPSGQLVLLKTPRIRVTGLLYLLVLNSSDAGETCTFLAPVEGVFWYSAYAIKESFLWDIRDFGEVPCRQLNELSVAEFEERLSSLEGLPEIGNAE